MQYVLQGIARLIISVVVGWLLVPLTVVVWLPIAAIQALYDEKPYRSALRKRVGDAAETVASVGAFLTSGLG